MKHIKNLSGIAIKLAVQMFFIISGYFILPLAVLFTEETNELTNVESNPGRKFKWNWVNKFWGNDRDGFADIYYKTTHYPNGTHNKYWPMLKWCVWRNPANNLMAKLGVKDTIVELKKHGTPHRVSDSMGREGFNYWEAYDENGKMYPMYYACYGYYQIPVLKNFKWFDNLITDEDGVKKGFRLLLGYKNFNLDGRELPYKADYNFTVSITPIKSFNQP
jgi:hypothetical protein